MNDLAIYHAWNIAMVRFSATPDTLTPEQTERLTSEVERARILEMRILETRESATITVPFDHVTDAVEGWRQENPQSPLADTVLFEALHRELRVQAVLDAVAARAPEITDAAVQAFFNTEFNRFQKPERRVVRHILITVNPEFP
ncbi:MAG: hypothetical protein JXQ84_02495, partial [Rhodospirillaceae bacterium]|nr:hypothetical protein [Rhodospirillaceae bacterium]